MVRCRATLPGFLILCLGFAGPALAGPQESAAEPAPRGVVEENEVVAITEHSAYWASVHGLSALLAEPEDGLELLVLRGMVENRAGRTLLHVKLLYELLDGDGRVVLAEHGYNRCSEMLREIDSPFPWPVVDPPHQVIPAGGSDSFRMLFLREETPPFASYRVKILEAAAAAE